MKRELLLTIVDIFPLCWKRSRQPVPPPGAPIPISAAIQSPTIVPFHRDKVGMVKIFLFLNLYLPEFSDPQNPENVRPRSSNSYKNVTP